MMRILMFGWEYPPHITGGLGTACYWLANSLTEKGVQINFLAPGSNDIENQAPDAGKSDPARSIEAGVEKLSIVLSKLLHKITIPSGLSPYGGKPLALQGEKETEQTLENLLKKELVYFNKSAAQALEGIQYDLIHAHDWPTFGAAILMHKMSDKPLILHVHSTEIDRNGDHRNEFIFRQEKQGFTKANKIIAVSHYTKKTLIDHYGVSAEKIEVVYHGVPPGFNNHKTAVELPRFREKIVTFCGRITHQKGPSYFINATNKLAEKSDQIRFIMAGDGDLREKMIELTAEMGISKRFHFPGFLTNEEVKNLWQISDALVMPSVSEPFGLTAVEAMSANLPVIVSRQSGLAELFPDLLQVNYWETEAMAELIFRLINDPQMTLLQKQENQRRLSKLSWTTAADQVIDLYHSVNSAAVK